MIAVKVLCPEDGRRHPHPEVEQLTHQHYECGGERQAAVVS
jgi:hypothetical protein